MARFCFVIVREICFQAIANSPTGGRDSRVTFPYKGEPGILNKERDIKKANPRSSRRNNKRAPGTPCGERKRKHEAQCQPRESLMGTGLYPLSFFPSVLFQSLYPAKTANPNARTHAQVVSLRLQM